MAHEPDSQTDTPPDRRELIAYHLDALNDLADPASRVDGWTPFARKLFLSTLASTGQVRTACDYAGLTRQSAYALRTRDLVFAAGWDAACEMARTPLADALYEQAVEGITETVTRDDGSTITRHRFDSRLSIAVLNRLDRRCDLAAEQGARHLGALARWDEFVAAIGNADEEAAQAILAEPEIAKPCQPCQLPDVEEEETDEEDCRIWWDEELEEWRTDFPPPEGFAGDQLHEYGAWKYSRALTAGELALVEQDCRLEKQAAQDADATDRDQYFAALRAELANELLEPDPDPGSQPEHAGVEDDGHGDPDGEREPEAKAGAQHRRKQQKQRHRRQEEPEGALGQLGDACRVAGVAPQPDESEQRNQRQRDDQPSDSGPAPRDLGSGSDNRP